MLSPDFKKLFEAAPGMNMIISTDLHILATSDDHLKATMTKRDEVVGKLLWDVFPKNPDELDGTGRSTLEISLLRAINTGQPDTMAVIKYDIPREDGTFEERYWSPQNIPILDDNGNVLYILNKTEEVTQHIKLKEQGVHYEQLSEEAKKLESQMLYRAKEVQDANARLQNSQEELQVLNEELISAQEALQSANEEMRAQHEELLEANATLGDNIETLEKARMALLLKTEELSRSNSFKSDFLSNMSHELRTPLNSMLILSKLLGDNKNGNLSVKQVEQAGIIHKAGNDLLMLINDILDLSKIEAGKMEMVMEKTSIRQVAEGVLHLFTPIAGQNEIIFNVQVAGELPDMIHTDRQRMEQILKNLLSNAFKFTPKGGMVSFRVDTPTERMIHTYRSLLGTAPAMIAFSVVDTGIGIPQHKQEAIFDAFQQADSGTARKYGGTGLGLSISRQLAGLLGGSIVLESEEGNGSQFTLLLPASDIEVPATRPVEILVSGRDVTRNVTIKYNSIPASQSQSLKDVLDGRTILVVDDDERNVTSLMMVLEGYGPVIKVATNGREALRALASDKKIDLVLMDIMMPEMDGFETMERIRTDPAHQNLPIIALTAKAMKSDLEKCLRAGASDYLPKPIDVQHLFSIMEVWLKSERTERVLRSQ